MTTDDNPTADAVEITPEMVEAGQGEYCTGDLRFDLLSEVVSNIYRAMETARRQSRAVAIMVSDPAKGPA